MPQDVRVLIVEDDPYARDCMALLLTRDWRTRLVGEAGTEVEAGRALAQPVDVILLDTEVPENPEWPFRWAGQVRTRHHRPVTLCTGTRPTYEVLRQLLPDGFGGYILKSEVLYALAGAVRLAAAGKWVTTPGVQQLAHDRRLTLPANTVVLSGTGLITDFTTRESEIARLAILFSQSQPDLAEELQIRQDQVGKLVSSAYEKMGLHDILSGETRPETFFDDQEVLERFQAARKVVEQQQEAGVSTRRRKVPEMATLAFHLLTVPYLEWGR